MEIFYSHHGAQSRRNQEINQDILKLLKSACRLKKSFNLLLTLCTVPFHQQSSIWHLIRSPCFHAFPLDVLNVSWRTRKSTTSFMSWYLIVRFPPLGRSVFLFKMANLSVARRGGRISNLIFWTLTRHTWQKRQKKILVDFRGSLQTGITYLLNVPSLHPILLLHIDLVRLPGFDKI